MTLPQIGIQQLQINKIFHRPLDVMPQFCDSIVKACCILHSFIRRNDGFQLEETPEESMWATKFSPSILCHHTELFRSMIWNLTYPEKVFTSVNYH